MSAKIVWWGGYWMKSMMLSLGDGKRIFEMAAGIPAIAGSRVCHGAAIFSLPPQNIFYFIYFPA